MTDLSFSYEKAVAITQIPGGLVSLCSSAAIINMILRSKQKPKSPSKRIMFFVSFYDMFQSFASAMSVLPAPKGMEWGALGNEGTCSMQGFLIQVSSKY
jgi:hypothetical protein